LSTGDATDGDGGGRRTHVEAVARAAAEADQKSRAAVSMVFEHWLVLT
jgi:hypothetical protein